MTMNTVKVNMKLKIPYHAIKQFWSERLGPLPTPQFK